MIEETIPWHGPRSLSLLAAARTTLGWTEAGAASSPQTFASVRKKKPTSPHDTLFPSVKNCPKILLSFDLNSLVPLSGTHFYKV